MLILSQNIMKKVFIILLLSIVTLFAEAQQIKQFTADTIVYINEIRKFTNNYVSSEELKIVDKFISLWQNSSFTWEEMSVLADNSTKLVRKNGRPSPHFVRYLEVLNLLYSADARNIGRNEWMKSMDFFLTERNAITIRTA